MKPNNFIFADLSTYDLATAQNFYSRVFDWNFVTEDNAYFIATHQGKEIIGLYETPKKFQEMKMPSFWMSYIQVNSVDQTVEQARALGGIIEVVENNAIGKVALIRDPLGAGFTVYEGNQLNSRTSNETNSLVWNELFISDFSKIESFYKGIFNWEIKASNQPNRHFIYNQKNEQIGAIQEVSKAVKGKYEYWGIFFGVKSIADTKQKVLSNGGTLIYEDKAFTSMSDSFGAFFHLVKV
ncbi:MAG: VOC family protein [Bacteroidota bacterium]